jgi:hypothetical protein
MSVASVKDEFDFPRVGERLFAGNTGDPRLSAYVRPMVHADAAWDHYIEGYRIAAQAALEHVVSHHEHRDRIVFPIVFLYRHHFELCLKAIIVFGNGLFDQTFKFPGHHDLVGLWSLARPLLVRRWKHHAVLDTVEEQLKELSRFDRGSFAYRYPVEKDGETCSHPQHHPEDPKRRFHILNIEHFCNVAELLSEFLGPCAYGLWCELGDKQDAVAEQLMWWNENDAER